MENKYLNTRHKLIVLLQVKLQVCLDKELLLCFITVKFVPPLIENMSCSTTVSRCQCLCMKQTSSSVPSLPGQESISNNEGACLSSGAERQVLFSVLCSPSPALCGSPHPSRPGSFQSYPWVFLRYIKIRPHHRHVGAYPDKHVLAVIFVCVITTVSAVLFWW